MYWETGGLFGVSFVSDQMGRDRFLLLHANLSFDLHALEELILTTCRNYWQPAQALTLDEAIAAFRGRYRYKVVIRGKPHPTGLKYFTLTDKLHFIFAFHRYGGEQVTVADIISKFANVLPHTGHKFYGDKWFGGVNSVEQLLARGHTSIFSCKKNRPTTLWSPLHASLRNRDLAAGGAEDPRVIGVTWVDRTKAQPKKVNLLTSYYTLDEATRVVPLDDRGNSGPLVVQEYREGKSYGDVANASLVEYSFTHRQRKWPHAGLTFLLQVCMHDAWVLFNSHTGSSAELLDFLKSCIEHKLRRPPADAPYHPSHLIAKSEDRRSCAHCYATRGARSSTPYVCATCRVALHPDCFIDYHRS
jgi:hypothetical protein